MATTRSWTTSRVEPCERYGTGKDVLECGVRYRASSSSASQELARRAVGIDLSPGMLEACAAARPRGPGGKRHQAPVRRCELRCDLLLQGARARARTSASRSPRWPASRDQVASSWPSSTTRGASAASPSGSARPGRSATRTRESACTHAFRSRRAVLPKILPPGTRVETARGIRIVTPAAAAMSVPRPRGMLRARRAVPLRHARRVLRRILHRRHPQGCGSVQDRAPPTRERSACRLAVRTVDGAAVLPLRQAHVALRRLYSGQCVSFRARSSSSRSSPLSDRQLARAEPARGRPLGRSRPGGRRAPRSASTVLRTTTCGS